jgi:hypothetical protein
LDEGTSTEHLGILVGLSSSNQPRGEWGIYKSRLPFVML